MNGRLWTEGETDVLRARYPHELSAAIARDLARPLSSVHCKAAQLGLHKRLDVIAQMARERSSRPDHGGRAFQFRKGHVPWSKGTKGIVGRHPNSRATQFKKDQVSNRWHPDFYCIGALRINADGGLDIKVRDGGYRGPGDYAWISLARYVWERARGPIPIGKVIRPRNGDSHDTRLSNLRLASRADLMRENTLWNLPRPLAGVIQLRGALNRKIKEQERRA